MIITFDLTNHSSFNNVKDWINSVKKYTDEDLPMVLVGNKIDLADAPGKNARMVSHADGTAIAEHYNMQYFETSAKTDVGVTDLMQHTFKQTYDFKIQKRAK